MSFSATELVLVGTVLISWAALLLSMVALRRIQRQSTSVHNLVSQLNRDLMIASNGAVGMGQRIIKLERRLSDFLDDEFSLDAEPTSILVPPTSESEVTNSKTAVVNTTAPEMKKENLSVPPGIAKQSVSLKVQTGQTRQQSKQDKPSLAVIDANEENTAANKAKPAATSKNKSTKQQLENSRKLTSFELAEKLFLQGLDADEVAKRCGLTPSEAALMQLVQKQQAQAAG